MKRFAPLLSLLAGCHLLMDPDAVPPPAPSGLAYSSEAITYLIDQPIAANRPFSGGGPASSYAVDPPLPAGLALDPVTGLVSGTPTQPSLSTTYTVTASNAGGSATATLRIAVKIGDLTAQEGSWDVGCAIVNGAAWCWENTDPNPAKVPGLTKDVQWISGWSYRGCAVVDGGAWCWGENSSGQLGNGTTTSSSVPVPVTGLTSGVQAIDIGQLHACAVVDGGAWCWGSLASQGILVPAPVQGLSSGVQALAVGELTNCALRDGGVECFNNIGLTPVPVAGLSEVTELTTGGYHSCALVNGAAKCWGTNDFGQLGDGSLTNRSDPVQVMGLQAGVQAIAAGWDSTCAVIREGVQCWGNGQNGGLGNGSTASSLAPTPAYGLASGVGAVRANQSDTCALVNGGLQCWGGIPRLPVSVPGFGP